jgi:hypothetical protein
VLDVIAFQKNETPENAPGIHFFSWVRKPGEFHVPEEALQYALKRSPFA